MIESARSSPGLRVVARFAAHRITIRALQGHAVIEVVTVRIHVAPGATKILEVKRQYFIGTTTRTFLVTIIARNYRVCALQRESRGPMHRDGKFRPVKIIDCMTGFTAVLIGTLGELPIMRILVAIRALRKCDFVNRIRSSRDVALGACHAGVLA